MQNLKKNWIAVALSKAHYGYAGGIEKLACFAAPELSRFPIQDLPESTRQINSADYHFKQYTRQETAALHCQLQLMANDIGSYSGVKSYVATHEPEYRNQEKLFLQLFINFNMPHLKYSRFPQQLPYDTFCTLMQFHEPEVNRIIFNPKGVPIQPHTRPSEYIRDPFVMVSAHQAICCSALESDAMQIITQLNQKGLGISLKVIPGYFEGGNLLVVSHSKRGTPVILHGHHPRGYYAKYDPEQNRDIYEESLSFTGRSIQEATGMPVVPIKMASINNDGPPLRYSDIASTYYHLDCYAIALPDGRILCKDLSMLSTDTIRKLHHYFDKEMIIDLKDERKYIFNILVLPGHGKRPFTIVGPDLREHVLQRLPKDLREVYLSSTTLKLATKQEPESGLTPKVLSYLTQAVSPGGGIHCKTQSYFDPIEKYIVLRAGDWVALRNLAKAEYNRIVGVIKSINHIDQTAIICRWRSSQQKDLKVDMKKMKKIRAPMKAMQLQASDLDILASLEAKHLTSRDTLPVSGIQEQNLSAYLQASGSPLLHF